MILADVLKTGKRFKRESEGKDTKFRSGRRSYRYNAEEILADDWMIEPEDGVARFTRSEFMKEFKSCAREMNFFDDEKLTKLASQIADNLGIYYRPND